MELTTRPPPPSRRADGRSGSRPDGASTRAAGCLARAAISARSSPGIRCGSRSPAVAPTRGSSLSATTSSKSMADGTVVSGNGHVVGRNAPARRDRAGARHPGAVMHTHSVWSTVALGTPQRARADSRSPATRCSRGSTASRRTTIASGCRFSTTIRTCRAYRPESDEDCSLDHPSCHRFILRLPRARRRSEGRRRRGQDPCRKSSSSCWRASGGRRRRHGGSQDPEDEGQRMAAWTTPRPSDGADGLRRDLVVSRSPRHRLRAGGRRRRRYRGRRARRRHPHRPTHPRSTC